MARIKQCVCVPIFVRENLGVEAICKAAAEIGYQAVEFWGLGEDLGEKAALAKQYGLALASIVGHNGGFSEQGLNNPEAHAALEQELRASIDLAAKYGLRGLICLSGLRHASQTREEAIRATADGLRRVAPYAEDKGVNLNLELLNSKVDHPGYDCDSTAWGVAVCEQVNSPRVKLLYDIYHMQIMEGDLIRTIRENIRWIGHFHTAGNPGRNEMDDTQELNYAGICRAIAGTDYDGYVGHEFAPKGDPIAALRQAFTVCDQG